jgi:hypothetical protein
MTRHIPQWLHQCDDHVMKTEEAIHVYGMALSGAAIFRHGEVCGQCRVFVYNIRYNF